MSEKTECEEQAAFSPPTRVTHAAARHSPYAHQQQTHVVHGRAIVSRKRRRRAAQHVVRRRKAPAAQQGVSRRLQCAAAARCRRRQRGARSGVV